VSTDSVSHDSVAEADLSDFETFSTSVGYRTDGSTFTGTGFVDGTVAPEVAARDASPGDTVSWLFSSPVPAGIAPGATSDLVEISTDATNYTAGKVEIAGAGSNTYPGFRPGAPCRTARR
jgi:hypothetical protein